MPPVQFVIEPVNRKSSCFASKIVLGQVTFRLTYLNLFFFSKIFFLNFAFISLCKIELTFRYVELIFEGFNSKGELKRVERALHQNYYHFVAANSFSSLGLGLFH